jgi:hypothetical protein
VKVITLRDPVRGGADEVVEVGVVDEVVEGEVVDDPEVEE